MCVGMTLVLASLILLAIVLFDTSRRLSLMEKDRNQVFEELCKLKLLNKLKVDTNGNPIIYEDYIVFQIKPKLMQSSDSNLIK